MISRTACGFFSAKLERWRDLDGRFFFSSRIITSAYMLIILQGIMQEVRVFWSLGSKWNSMPAHALRWVSSLAVITLPAARDAHVLNLCARRNVCACNIYFANFASATKYETAALCAKTYNMLTQSKRLGNSTIGVSPHKGNSASREGRDEEGHTLNSRSRDHERVCN